MKVEMLGIVYIITELVVPSGKKYIYQKTKDCLLILALEFHTINVSAIQYFQLLNGKIIIVGIQYH